MSQTAYHDIEAIHRTPTVCRTRGIHEYYIDNLNGANSEVLTYVSPTSEVGAIPQQEILDLPLYKNVSLVK